MNSDEYFTINGIQQAEIKIKGSKFIGTVSPAASEALAKSTILEISKKYFDATHNCFAYQVGLARPIISRSSDDGEPAGTAGLPILNVIKGRNLTNLAVVVTRYYGGTKLGKGGLIRAYSECARLALDKCTIVKKYIFQTIDLTFDYNLTGPVMRIVSQFEAKVVDSQYGDQTFLKLSLRKSKVDDFQDNIVEISSGRVSIVRSE